MAQPWPEIPAWLQAECVRKWVECCSDDGDLETLDVQAVWTIIGMWVISKDVLQVEKWVANQAMRLFVEQGFEPEYIIEMLLDPCTNEVLA